MTVAEAVAAATRRLTAAGVPAAARDARRLVAHALGVAPDRMTLVAREPFGAAAALEAALSRREARQPVSQIVGSREFRARRFRVTPDVLDPRPETETLIDVALQEQFGNVLDLGTGTGCILLTLMAERPGAAGTGTDLSPAALTVARENAAAMGLAPELVEADWFVGMTGRWDLIVSNPPYIAEAEMATLAPEVRWEPELALAAGGDGLAAYRRIAASAADHLEPGARLVLEIGPSQAEAVIELLAAGGLGDFEVARDLDGRDRVVSARLVPRS